VDIPQEVSFQLFVEAFVLDRDGFVVKLPTGDREEAEIVIVT
jgi:hypothetical protein